METDGSEEPVLKIVKSTLNTGRNYRPAESKSGGGVLSMEYSQVNDLEELVMLNRLGRLEIFNIGENDISAVEERVTRLMNKPGSVKNITLFCLNVS